MIIKKVESVIEKQKKEDGFIYPYYEKYCFSNIPSTILSFFGIKNKRPILPSELYKGISKSKKVILLLIDGLGYKQWLKYYKRYNFFKIITEKGMLSPLTSVFPSTTAAAITTINTGLTPQEHLLLEWFVYFKKIDMILATLPFESPNNKEQERFLKMKVNPKILFRGKTIYQILKKFGIKSFSFNHEKNSKSEYSKLIYKGSTAVPFINSSDLVVKLRKYIEKEKGPAYFYAYFGDLDAIEHRCGPHTEEYYAELSTLSHLLKTELLEKVDKKTAKDTIIIVTSDHGQVNIFPKETVYLNKYRNVVNSFQKSSKGRPIWPTGSPRDAFLYIKPNKLDEILNFLLKKLNKKAKVMKSLEAAEKGMFGLGRADKEFYNRIGNLLIVSKKNNTVWHEYEKGKKVEFLGHHGSLTKEEMLVPFAIAKLSTLTKR